MKKLLFIITVIQLGFVNAQTTTIPDQNFEQALIDLGLDNGVPDGTVLTSNISSVLELWVDGYNISDLTGIEDFVALKELYCDGNLLSSLNLSQNTNLTILNCEDNNLNSLDLSQNTMLDELWCGANPFTFLDITQNTALTWFDCSWSQITDIDFSQNVALTGIQISYGQMSNIDVTQNVNLVWLNLWSNQLTELDVSQNGALTDIQCQNNQLMCLNVKNGNNSNMTGTPGFRAFANPNLTCIEVDDVAWSTANWTVANNNIDASAYFSTDCGTCVTTIEEISAQQKKLIHVTDYLGRESQIVTNTPLIYIYSDGSTEKVFRVE